MASGGVRITNLAEFRKALRDVDERWDSAISLAHQKIGSLGAKYSRAEARSMGGVQARAASAIGEKHTVKYASVALQTFALDKMANVAYWGAKKRTGWYANPRYSDTRLAKQHPPWVGNTWEVAVAGQGPYAINDALATNLEELLEQYLLSLERITKAAFPEGG